MADEESTQREDTPHYDGPAGGWGSLKGMGKIVVGEHPTPAVLETLWRQNKPDGHMCTSCAWAKPARPHPFEFCENGAKATIWELTEHRCGPDFFAGHTVAELRDWHDHDLEAQGRLTHPMRHDPETGRYVEASWGEAFAAIGKGLRRLDPRSVVFYTSGRASLETSFLWQLFARLYGHNNLPDSSNMCHETTSVALKKVIGSPFGTCILDDFEHCDLILMLGQNTGTCSPRFLHQLRAAVKRGCRIVTLNPVREVGLLRFRNPQSPLQMLGGETQISDLYLQVRPGGDMAALTGIIKRVLELDGTRRDIIDREFIEAHTTGFAEFAAFVRDIGWDEIEAESGLARAHLEEIGDLCASASAAIGMYGLGLTQHVHGGDTLGMFVNLMLLRGNIGRLGTGISPIRGHSNVQGQRTVGITEKPELAPLDELAGMFDFEQPCEAGRTSVEVGEGLIDGSVRSLFLLGGNLARSLPDVSRTNPAWASLDLVVHVATKLNPSHLLPGKETWLLPCLARSEEDLQATGPQAVTIEDSLSHIYASRGRRTPAAPTLLSEPAIVAGMAKATLPPNPKVTWDEWIGDYALVRAMIERIWPDQFAGFETRMHQPGGFYRGNKARERVWQTDSGKAVFTVPPTLSGLGRPLGEGGSRSSPCARTTSSTPRSTASRTACGACRATG